ncbi:MAG: class I SAM-dependent methyltransferase [Chloroflexi bacterium]|nr:MAG: class I SAM-dependent methyltransferase [Chloroflexota bacterium]
MHRKSLLSLKHAVKHLPPRKKWDTRYAALHPAARLEPSPFVQASLPRLPAGGPALDIAAGAGRHSLALARRGFVVDAVDISWQGLRLAQQRAATTGLSDRVRCIVGDVEHGWLPRQNYAVILVSYFLYRPLFPLIHERLLPGGWLIYETFTLTQLDQPYHPGSTREEFYLRPNELRHAFAGLTVVTYHEGRHQDRFTAQLLARKPERAP